MLCSWSILTRVAFADFNAADLVIHRLERGLVRLARPGTSALSKRALFY